LLAVLTHDRGGRLQPNADGTALVDECALCGDPPDDILPCQYRRHRHHLGMRDPKANNAVLALAICRRCINARQRKRLAGIALFDDEGNPARDSFYRRLGSSISGDAAALRRIAAEDLPDRG
jgi:hypothetical protein